MIITKASKETFVFKTRIEFTIDGQVEFVELRELNMSEQNQIITAGKLDAEGNFTDIGGMLQQAEKFFCQCITDHSGVDEEGNKVSNKDLYDTLKTSASLFQEILSTWMRSKRMDISFEKTEGSNPLA